MNVFPVIKREMRAEARRPATYWTRVTVGGLVTLALVWVCSNESLRQGVGPRLFYLLNSLLFVAIWIGVPLLTSEALSAEKRNGTLGLLFLTSLNAREIVVGKSIAHVLRGLNLIWAVLPLLVIPIVLGGLRWEELVMALMFDAGSVVIALGVGMVASAFCRQWWQSVPLSLMFSAIALFLTLAAWYRFVIWLLLRFVGGVASAQDYERVLSIWSNSPVLEKLAIQAPMVTGAVDPVAGNFAGYWGMLIDWNGPEFWLSLATVFLGASLLICWIAASFSAWHLSRCWRDEPESARVKKVRRVFLSPMILKERLRQRLRRSLSGNPIAWLHQQSWKVRVAKWSWCLGTMFVSAKLLNDPMIHYNTPVTFLRLVALTVLLAMSYTAIASFRAERDAGSLELLLVTPLKLDQLVRGRIQAIWWQYLPALLVLIVVWESVYFDLPERFFNLHWHMFWGEPLILLAAAWNWVSWGVRFSFGSGSFLLGWFRSLILGGVLPGVLLLSWFLFMVPDDFGRLPVPTFWTFPATLFFIALQLWLAETAVKQSYKVIHQRTFLPNPSGT